MTVADALIAPFRFGFMADALIISLLVAVPAALLSCFLVLKGWSLLGDAISHAVLPGVVISYALLGLPYIASAFATSLACAVGIGYIGDHSRVKPDTVMGVVYSGMFGAGLVLYVWIHPDVHLDHILFGDMLGVSRADTLLSAGIALVTTGVIVVKWRDLQMHAFDPVQARAVGLPTRFLHYGLLCLISATVVGALAAVGIILVIALLIAPGAIALLVTCSLGQMLLVAVALATSASAAGLLGAFYIDAAPAPTIVLLLAAGFVVAFTISDQRAAIAARG